MCHYCIIIQKYLKKFKNNPFTIEEAEKHGLSRLQLSRLTQKGVLERLQQGVYQVSRNITYDQDAMFTQLTAKIKHQSAICLVSALEYYHLSETVSPKTWFLVDSKVRVSSSQIRLFRSRHAQWDIGIVKHNRYSITSLERSIVDTLAYKHIVGSQIALWALRQAIKSKKTQLNKLITMAKKRMVFEKILPYLESLSI